MTTARVWRALAIAVALGAHNAHAQDRGAAAVTQGVFGFATTARVLIIGAHPDDEDTGLITWLARGRQVETAYLSLTRGDGGQNLIGNELREALGAIRTEELLAARRIDGGHQYFTRAFDFGFSKDSAETFLHWPREQTLGDVVRVVRAFRPHVIIAEWTGTARDGHGHHTVAGLLARDAYELAGDTSRFPEREFGAAWTPAKFYRRQRGAPTPGTLAINVGEFDRVLGRSYADIATDSRTQHKSQGQGTLPRDGVVLNAVRREASRVNASAAEERSIFDGIDTSWTRFSGAATLPALRAVVDSLPVLARAARAALDLRNPGGVVPLLARAADLLDQARIARRCRFAVESLGCTSAASDLGASIEVAYRRVTDAVLAAAGVALDALVDREYFANGDTATVTIKVENRGGSPVTIRRIDVLGGIVSPDSAPIVVAPDSVVGVARRIFGYPPGATAWWIDDRAGFDFFPEKGWPADGARGSIRSARQAPVVPAVAVAEDAHLTSFADVRISIDGHEFTRRIGPFMHRRLDAVDGEVRRPMVGVGAISVLFDRTLELMRANEPIDRVIRLRVQSMSTRPRPISLEVRIPQGLLADALPDTMTLAPLETRDISIHVRGRVPEDRLPMTAIVTEARTRQYGTGYIPVQYEHIRPIVLIRDAGLWLRGIRVTIPTGVQVAYVPGVSDDAAAVLQQLDVPVTIIEPERFGSASLAGYQVIVLGPRVYARAPKLAEFNDRLEAFARNGGTVFVQYGQGEMARKGMLPYSVEFANNNGQRVTMEDAPVRMIDSAAAVLRAPNRITTADFSGWVQERSLYMPTRVDSVWKSVIEMNDPGEPPNRNAILVAKVGQGTYVYSSLSLFRQLPSGVDGAIRLFVNLLSAGLRAPSQ